MDALRGFEKFWWSLVSSITRVGQMFHLILQAFIAFLGGGWGQAGSIP